MTGSPPTLLDTSVKFSRERRRVWRMELGFTSMNTPEDVDPTTLGRALEERGFTSLWIGEHSHIPASRKTPYPIGGELPPMYRRMMDPLPSLLAGAWNRQSSLRLSDALYVELAEITERRLITSDRKLGRDYASAVVLTLET